MGNLVASSIDAGGAATCAVVADGAVSCWGRNENGAMGNGVTTTTSARPTLVLGITGATRRAPGSTDAQHSRADVADCWGFNRSGELGDGTLHSRSVPAPVLDP